MIVVDATIWVDNLRGVLPGGCSQRIVAEGCASPPHVDFEVGAALLRLERRGELGNGSARVLIDLFRDHPVDRVFHRDDALTALDMTANASYADAWYLALAERLGSPVMTTDRGMAEAARILGVDLIGGM